MKDPIGPEFMARTRHRFLGRSDQQKGLPAPALERPVEAGAERIDLPAPHECPTAPIDLARAIRDRVSVREFATSPVTLAELSFLLWCTQGVKRVLPGAATFRTVPSAGARHALETCLLVNRVEGLPAGLYRFLAGAHALVRIRAGGEVADEVVDGCLGQRFVKAAGATFIWMAEAYRMTWRYGQRGYRYLHLDAGHVCQNLYLAAQAVGCGVCAVAAFDDDKLNDLLALDGAERFVIYLAAAGRPAAERRPP